MDTRKIQLVGNRSYAVSLPKHWVLQNRLKEQSILAQTIAPSGELVLRKAEGAKADMKSVHYDSSDSRTLVEFLVYSYENDVDKITLRFADKDYKSVNLVRYALTYLEGYEVTAEDEHTMDITFLFKETTVTLPKLLLRIHYLLKLHADALRNNDAKGLGEVEHSVDRLYHLSNRIISSCLHDWSKRAENDIVAESELIYLSLLVKRLETLSDILTKVRESKCGKAELEYIDRMLDWVGRTLRQSVDMPAQKTELRNITMPRTPSKAIARIHDICHNIFEARICIFFARQK
jgi:phosphate uptake regulator